MQLLTPASVVNTVSNKRCHITLDHITTPLSTIGSQFLCDGRIMVLGHSQSECCTQMVNISVMTVMCVCVCVYIVCNRYHLLCFATKYNCEPFIYHMYKHNLCLLPLCLSMAVFETERERAKKLVLILKMIMSM